MVLLADARAVAVAWDAGAGATIEVSLGGRSDALHGAPVPVTATVVRLGDGSYIAGGTWMTGATFAMGRTAVLAVGGVTVLVMERATPPFHAEQLTSNGIDPIKAKIIVAKGAVAWRAAYEEVMAEAIAADTPGCCSGPIRMLARVNRPVAVEPAVPRPRGSWA